MDLETKPWWASMGVWGSLVTVVASFAGIAGYTIGPDDQAAIVAGVGKAVTIGMDSVALFGGLVSLWGRVRASKKIA